MLIHPVDAKKLRSGATMPMKLTRAVHFANGTQLPAGTMLDATVVQDDMQLNGKFKLALRFTEAKTKDGKTIPIKATILAVAAEAIPGPNGPDMGETELTVPDNLNNQPDVVDSEGVAPGVDLHSKASDQNSGVLGDEEGRHQASLWNEDGTGAHAGQLVEFVKKAIGARVVRFSETDLADSKAKMGSRCVGCPWLLALKSVAAIRLEGWVGVGWRTEGHRLRGGYVVRLVRRGHVVRSHRDLSRPCYACFRDGHAVRPGVWSTGRG